jgi:exodeoxyribonuclease V alpha subunit
MIPELFAKKLLETTDGNTEANRACLQSMYALFKQGNLAVTKEQLGPAIDLLPSSLIGKPSSNVKTPFIQHENLYYLHKNWIYETEILKNIQRLRAQPFPSFFNSHSIKQKLDSLQTEGLCLPEQIEALRSATSHLFSVVCGGPGTGKTYVASHLASILKDALIREKKPSLRISLAAPTGKAAFHLQKILELRVGLDASFSFEATTLHRLLRIRPNQNLLIQDKKIDADVVIIDEASMIDIPTLSALFASIGSKTLLILIGDPDQLPPVETGGLFAEISDAFGIFLKRPMRTDQKELQELISQVKQGDIDAFFSHLRTSLWHELLPEFSWLYEKTNPILQETRPDPSSCLETYKRFRIINALRQGPYGGNRINQWFFEQLKTSGRWWAAPILSTTNDPQLNLYNGTEGILIGRGQEKPTAYFEGVPMIPAPPFEIAFCISIHKAQGSEFDQTLVLFPQGSENFGKESLYTGLTRSKKKIEIVGTRETLEKMIRGHFRPVSGLLKRLNPSR